jgi:hypothetical protein
VPNSIALTESAARGVHTGVPMYFRGCCRTAAQGGADGYYGPGFTLARSLGNEVPDDIDWDEWGQEIDALQGLLGQGDTDGTWQWFARHYPKMMALIPVPRRNQFIAGVRAAYDDGLVAL